MSAESAAWAKHMPDELICHAALEFLIEGVEAEKPVCSKCHFTRWQEDGYLGGYLMLINGCYWKHDTAVLQYSKWNGRLILAGEHTISKLKKV
jgi:monoamine oxidase